MLPLLLIAALPIHLQLEGGTAHIRPLPRALAGARTARGVYTMPKLQYYGGKILGQVELVPVYWDDANHWFSSTAGAQFVKDTDSFYAALVASTMFDWLAEYSTPSQKLLHGTAKTGVVLASKLSNTAQTLSETAIEKELAARIATGDLPAHNADTLYQLHFAPGIQLVDQNTVGCRDYCAYHDSFQIAGSDVAFSVIPDHSPASACSVGCGESSAWFDNMTASATHETVEAVTDPYVGVSTPLVCPSWCDPAAGDWASDHAEIGDVCESDWTSTSGATSSTGTEARFSVNGSTWTAQREWSNTYNACLVNAADAFTLSLSPGTLRLGGSGPYDFAMSTNAPSTANITLGSFALPAGVTASMSQSGNGSTGTLHLSVPANTPPFQVMAFANGGSTLAYALANVDFDDFTATASGSASLRAGGSTTISVDTQAVTNSSAQSITFTLAGGPPGVTADPATVTSGQRATIALRAAAGSPSGTTPLSLQAATAVRSHAINVPLTVDGDDFDVTPPSSVSLNVGGTTNVDLATTTTHGAPQALTAALGNGPAGVTVSSNTAQSGSPLAVSITAPGDLPEGPVNLTLAVKGTVATRTLVVPATAHSGGCSTGGPALGWLALPALAMWVRRRRR